MAGTEQLGFQTPHRIVLLILSVMLLALVLELVRRRRFKERYALLWLASSLFGLVVGIFPGIIVWVSRVTHVQFLTVFFGITFVFFLGLILSFCVLLSQLSEQNRELAQEMALLAHRVADLEKEHDRNSGQ